MTHVNSLAAELAAIARELADSLAYILRHEPKNPFHDFFHGTNTASVINIDPHHFADTCAQTMIYGKFMGRLHGRTMQTPPKPLPFLHKLFALLEEHHAVRKLDDLLQAADIELLLKNFGKTTKTDDAAIHFYEHFLAAYNPDSRQAHGVFYTPQPVVHYIVRAVDEILRQEFRLQDGIAGNVHLLDPATGTGTFLAEIVKQIYAQKNQRDDRQQTADGSRSVATSFASAANCGLPSAVYSPSEKMPQKDPFDPLGLTWNHYVTNNLLPRLHGFEVLMTPFFMAHLNLAMLLEATGYRWTEDQSVHVHLQNALESTVSPTSAMVILGNPPYNVSTINKGKHSKDLIAKYKKGLGETKTNLDDDYIKFIAWGEQLIERNSTEGGILAGGILAYVTNNSFLSGVTHRYMRRSLLQTFDKIYILNLHGDARKKEIAPDESKDENVFHIVQGTSINIFVRRPAKKEKAGKIFYADLYGKRSEKYHFLETHRLATTGFAEIVPAEKNYFFVPKDLSLQTEYEHGFGMTELFVSYNSGIKTDRDPLFIDDDKELLACRIEKLLSGNVDEAFRKQYRIEDSSSYKITRLIQGKSFDRTCLRPVCYRPFDEKWIYYDPAILSRPGNRVSQHMLHDNIALLTSRLIPANHAFNRVFVATTLADGHAISDQTYLFPLYLYDAFGQRRENLNGDIVKNIVSRIGKETLPAMDIFDYVYGVLHDSQYRKKYQEFLTIDFPRVPYPAEACVFDRYVQAGVRLRTLHLLGDVPAIQTAFPVSGSNVVEHVRFAAGSLLINKTQYFRNVPASVWELAVGDYLPAQKYLKDRKGRVLTSEEIQHYQKIVAVLTVLCQGDGAE